jgi:hypothetical protein
MIFIHRNNRRVIDRDSNAYVEIDGDIINAPKELIIHLLQDCRAALIYNSKNIDNTKLIQITDLLTKHIYKKFGIIFNMTPIELDKYISDMGIKPSNVYDAELVGGADITDEQRILGKLIWCIEQIIINNDDMDDMPIPIHKLRMLIKIQPKTMPINSICSPNDKQCINEYIAFSAPHINPPKKRFTLNKYIPKDCAINRYDLNNYISDRACSDIYTQDVDSLILQQNNDNGEWRRTELLNRDPEFTQPTINEFTEPQPRKYKHKSRISYLAAKPKLPDMHNLTIDFMQKNKSLTNTKQKQELSDKWDHIESTIFEN